MDLFDLEDWPELQRRARRLRVTLSTHITPDGSTLVSVQRYGWFRDFTTLHDLRLFLDRLEGRPPPKEPLP